MAHCILFFLGLIVLWLGIKTADEVYRIALTSAAIVPIGWGYFYSPSLFQCLSGILILGVFQLYISYS